MGTKTEKNGPTGDSCSVSTLAETQLVLVYIFVFKCCKIRCCRHRPSSRSEQNR